MTSESKVRVPLRESPEGTLYLHGTVATLADAIERDGLVPRDGHAGVFVTREFARAHVYAHYATAYEMMANGAPAFGAIVGVAVEGPLPADTFHRGPIPPDRIVAIVRLELPLLADMSQVRTFAKDRCRDRATADLYPFWGPNGWEGPANMGQVDPLDLDKIDRAWAREFVSIVREHARRGGSRSLA